jgi:hypothetical protein
MNDTDNYTDNYTDTDTDHELLINNYKPVMIKLNKNNKAIVNKTIAEKHHNKIDNVICRTRTHCGKKYMISMTPDVSLSEFTSFVSIQLAKDVDTYTIFKANKDNSESSYSVMNSWEILNEKLANFNDPINNLSKKFNIGFENKTATVEEFEKFAKDMISIIHEKDQKRIAIALQKKKEDQKRKGMVNVKWR